MLSSSVEGPEVHPPSEPAGAPPPNALGEELFRLLAEGGADVVYRIRLVPDLACEYVNAAVRSLTGLGPEQFYRDPKLGCAMVHPEDVALWRASLEGPGEAGAPFTIRWKGKDGVWTWMEHRHLPRYDAKGRVVAVAGIARDVTERTMDDEQVERLRNEFIASAAQELKAPLRLIQAGLRSLPDAQHTRDPDAAGRALDQIRQEAARLEGLVDRLVDAAHLEAGALAIKPVPVDLHSLLKQIPTRVRRERAGGGPTVTVDLPPGLPPVNAERDRVVQVVSTVAAWLDSVSDPGSTLTIRAEHDATHVTVRLEAPEARLAAETASSVFRRSSLRAAGSRALSLDLALGVAKGVVEAHGGRIWVEPASERGVVVGFTLPIVAEPAGAVTVNPARRALHVGRVGQGAERAQILVVDDDPQIARYLRTLLVDAGYATNIVTDSSTVVALIGREEPDLVLLDIMMPGASGLDLLPRIRELSGVPVIFVTGRKEDAEKVHALKMGADDYITKPFSPWELLARIEAVLRRRVLPDMMEVRPPFHLHDLTVDFHQRRVSVGGRPAPLSATEYKLLYELASEAGRVLTHDQLLKRVWGPQYAGEGELLRSFIRNVRRKLGDDARHPRYIYTEPQVGYWMPKG